MQRKLSCTNDPLWVNLGAPNINAILAHEIAAPNQLSCAENDAGGENDAPNVANLNIHQLLRARDAAGNAWASVLKSEDRGVRVERAVRRACNVWEGLDVLAGGHYAFHPHCHLSRQRVPRTAVKLLELLEVLRARSQPRRFVFERVLDLGGAPGTWATVQRHQARRVAGFTLQNDQLGGYRPLGRTERCCCSQAVGFTDLSQCLGDGSGDLLVNANLEALGAQAHATGGWDLVQADLGVSGHHAEKDRVCQALALACVEAALRTLRPGGGFVCKVFATHTTGMAVACQLLTRNFTCAAAGKPLTSRPGNKELYFVASGFRGRRPGAEGTREMEREYARARAAREMYEPVPVRAPDSQPTPWETLLAQHAQRSLAVLRQMTHLIQLPDAARRAACGPWSGSVGVLMQTPDNQVPVGPASGPAAPEGPVGFAPLHPGEHSAKPLPWVPRFVTGGWARGLRRWRVLPATRQWTQAEWGAVLALRWQPQIAPPLTLRERRQSKSKSNAPRSSRKQQQLVCQTGLWNIRLLWTDDTRGWWAWCGENSRWIVITPPLEWSTRALQPREGDAPAEAQTRTIPCVWLAFVNSMGMWAPTSFMLRVGEGPFRSFNASSTNPPNHNHGHLRRADVGSGVPSGNTWLLCDENAPRVPWAVDSFNWVTHIFSHHETQQLTLRWVPNSQ